MPDAHQFVYDPVSTFTSTHLKSFLAKEQQNQQLFWVYSSNLQAVFCYILQVLWTVDTSKISWLVFNSLSPSTLAYYNSSEYTECDSPSPWQYAFTLQAIPGVSGIEGTHCTSPRKRNTSNNNITNLKEISRWGNSEFMHLYETVQHTWHLASSYIATFRQSVNQQHMFTLGPV